MMLHFTLVSTTQHVVEGPHLSPLDVGHGLCLCSHKIAGLGCCQKHRACAVSNHAHLRALCESRRRGGAQRSRSSVCPACSSPCLRTLTHPHRGTHRERKHGAAQECSREVNCFILNLARQRGKNDEDCRSWFVCDIALCRMRRGLRIGAFSWNVRAVQIAIDSAG